MPPDFDPDTLTADQRLRELAALLASGVLRLRDRDALSARPGQQAAPEIPPESAQDSLEVPAQPCSVSTGVNALQEPETRSTTWN